MRIAKTMLDVDIFVQSIFKLAYRMKGYVAVEIYVLSEAQNAIVVPGSSDSIATPHYMLDGIDQVLPAFVYASKNEFTENVYRVLVLRQPFRKNNKFRNGERFHYPFLQVFRRVFFALLVLN